MNAAEEPVEELELNNLVPLNSLNPESRNELISQSTIKRLPPGRHLFDQGDTDNVTVYLLSGQLVLITEGKPVITLKAGTDTTLNPIANQQPRTTTALARTSVTTLHIDTRLLNTLFTHDIVDSHKNFNAITSKQERIRQALEVPLFTHLPLAYKKVLIRRFEEIQVNAGDVIIREGNENKYFYLISEGRCCLTKKMNQYDISANISELTTGCGFGEETFITNFPPKYTVSMLEDGRLLALSRGEFMTLLARPLIKKLSYDQIMNMDQSTIALLDLRTPTAFRKSNLKASVNLSFSILKDIISLLDKTREYIICTDSYQRSAVAAFLMLKHGLNVKILGQGIRKTLMSLP